MASPNGSPENESDLDQLRFNEASWRLYYPGPTAIPLGTLDDLVADAAAGGNVVLGNVEMEEVDDSANDSANDGDNHDQHVDTEQAEVCTDLQDDNTPVDANGTNSDADETEVETEAELEENAVEENDAEANDGDDEDDADFQSGSSNDEDDDDADGVQPTLTPTPAALIAPSTATTTTPSAPVNRRVRRPRADIPDNIRAHPGVPYPAPPALIAESRQVPVGRSWSWWESDAAIRRVLEVIAEAQIPGSDDRFEEAGRRIALYDGATTRTGPTSVKNHWNRCGRERSNYDERRNRRAPMTTSQQWKKGDLNERPRRERQFRDPARRSKKSKKEELDEEDTDVGTPGPSIDVYDPLRKVRRPKDGDEDDSQPGAPTGIAATRRSTRQQARRTQMATAC